MARYEHDFMGIPARIRQQRGMDPNYQDGYRGMRMRGGEGQASYGMHRLRHAEDLGEAGGFQGRFGPGEGNRPLPRGYNPEWQTSGGVHNPRYDREYLREYNANSLLFREEPRRGYDREQRALPARQSPRVQRSPKDRGYSNRGLSSGGYSEHWISRRGGK